MQSEWNKNTIEALLQRSDEAVRRALVLLHNRQTTAEQAAGQTQVHNTRGFTGSDAEFLSSLAERVKRGWGLTPKQMTCMRRLNKAGFSILAKYHRQLIEEITAREEIKRAA